MQTYLQNFSLYQLIVPLFAILMMLKAVSRYRRHQQSWRELTTWIAVWGAVGFFALFPGISDHLARWVGIKSGANALITAALVILFYITFKLLVNAENLESKITKLNRHIALDKLKEEKDSAVPKVMIKEIKEAEKI